MEQSRDELVAQRGAHSAIADRGREIAAAIGAALLAAGALALQLGPYLQVELIARDEAYYRAFASVAARGGRLYTDFWDIHFPALYGVYVFVLNRVGDMTALRLFMLGTVWLGAIFFYVLLRRATTRGAALLGVTVFSVMVTSIGLEGRAVNTEHFIQTCVMAALLVASRRSSPRLFLAGGLIGLAALFKQQAILYLAVPAVMYWRQTQSSQLSPENRAAHDAGALSRFRESTPLMALALLGSGAATPIVLALAWAAAQGSLGAMFQATVVGLLSERIGATALLPRVLSARDLLVHFFQHAPTIMLGALLGLALFFDRRGSKADSAALIRANLNRKDSDPDLDREDPGFNLSRQGSGINPSREGSDGYDVVPDLVWIGVGCLSIALAGRAFPHYGILLVPPAIRMALAALDWSRPHRLVARPVGWALLAFIGVDAGLDAMHTITAQVGTYRSTIRGEDWDEYGAAQYLKAQMKPEDTIFVWGPRPGLYFFTDRVPTTPFVVQFPLVAETKVSRKLRSELTESLRKQPPSYFVVTPAPAEFSLERSELASLDGFLRSEYELDRTVERYEVYRRRSSPIP